MTDKAPEQNEEYLKKQAQDENIQGFLKEYGELVERRKIDFACYPVYTPNGNGGFETRVQNTPVDISNQPVKSPFIQPTK